MDDFEAAAGIFRTCRRRGKSVRRLVDCLIAAVAIRAGLEILHRDRDFDVIARHTGLRVVLPYRVLGYLSSEPRSVAASAAPQSAKPRVMTNLGKSWRVKASRWPREVNVRMRWSAGRVIRVTVLICVIMMPANAALADNSGKSGNLSRSGPSHAVHCNHVPLVPYDGGDQVTVAWGHIYCDGGFTPDISNTTTTLQRLERQDGANQWISKFSSSTSRNLPDFYTTAVWTCSPIGSVSQYRTRLYNESFHRNWGTFTGYSTASTLTC